MKRTIEIKKYYTCLEHLQKRFDVYGRKDAFHASSQEEYQRWKGQLREKLSELLGLSYMETCPLSPILEEKVVLENGIVREKICIQVEPDVWMPVYVLIPSVSNEKKLKCILAPPGHMGAGKYAVAGMSDIPAVKDRIEMFQYDYGMQIAKLGYVALCNDSRGFGERREASLQGDSEEKFLNSTCNELSRMAQSLGQTVIGMCVWDLMRLVDYIKEYRRWDTEEIGCLGFSGGGMQALWLAALDDRIAYAIISGYFYGYKDSLLTLNGNCSCNYVPRLWNHVDMGDIGALIAPRPIMVQSCQEDHLNGIRGLENVYEQMEIMRSAYRLFHAEERIFHDIREGGHCWHGENLKKFLEQWVGK